ncbi:MAG: pyridoxamine 5'-phosphate oxidase family protein [Planctomycetota bacterium]
MAKFFDEINDKLAEFIRSQKVFFVATADESGRINLSPKGYDALSILDSNRIIWMNLSGSGNETAAHLRVANRITLMFCSFVDPPLILRVYGTAETVHPRDENWNELSGHFDDFAGARQIFDVRVDSLQTSCGFGVPYFDFAGQRDKLIEHYAAKGVEATEKGWSTKNAKSIDGLDTGITG